MLCLGLRQILGQTRTKLWRDGEVELDQMTEELGELLQLKSYFSITLQNYSKNA